MPHSLIKWLLIEKLKIIQHIKTDVFIEEPILETKKTTGSFCSSNTNKNMILNVSNENIVRLLMKLDMSYCDDFEKWLLITNIFNNACCFEIWNDWSTMSKKYNYDTNV